MGLQLRPTQHGHWRDHTSYETETSRVILQAGPLKMGGLPGTGTPKREFLHVDDMAEASLFVLDLSKDTFAVSTSPMLSHINVGCGTDISILDLAETMAKITCFRGRIVTDPTKADGTKRKLMDV